LLKRGDKQFRRLLKTKDRKLADRRLAELRTRVGHLSISDDARLSFDDIATRWMDTTRHTLKASSITRRETCVKNLLPCFRGIAIRNGQFGNLAAVPAASDPTAGKPNARGLADGGVELLAG